MHVAGVSPMVGPGGGTWDPGPTRVPLGRSGWNDRRSAGTEGVGRRGVHEALVRGWQPLRLGSSHWKALWLTGKRWKSMYVHRGKALELVALFIVETSLRCTVMAAREFFGLPRA